MDTDFWDEDYLHYYYGKYFTTSRYNKKYMGHGKGQHRNIRHKGYWGQLCEDKVNPDVPISARLRPRWLMRMGNRADLNHQFRDLDNPEKIRRMRERREARKFKYKLQKEPQSSDCGSLFLTKG